jgi:hypothetical protein
MLSDKEIRLLYGKGACISRKGSFALVHLDQPSLEVIQERTREFDPKSYFFDDCPLCQMLKDGGVVVFDDSIEDDLIFDD